VPKFQDIPQLPINQDSIVFVQTSPGSYVRVRIPGLAGLSNRIIHKAELIAEQVPDDANLFTIEQLYEAS